MKVRSISKNVCSKVAEAKNPQNSGALLAQNDEEMTENESDSCILQPMLHMGNDLEFSKSQLFYFTSRRAPFWRDVRDVRETCVTNPA